MVSQIVNISQPQNPPQQTDDIPKLKIMMRELMDKMGSMLNIITALVAKMS